MKSVLISFRIKKGLLDEAKQLIQEFVNAVHTNEKETLMYKSFQQTADPHRFTHAMTFENDEAQTLHRNSSYCNEFVKQLYPLCEETPAAVEYNEFAG